MKNNPTLKKLKNARLVQGKTVRELSKRTGLSKSMYSYIENGKKRLSYDHAVKIANALGFDPDELFFDDFQEFYKETLI